MHLQNRAESADDAPEVKGEAALPTSRTRDRHGDWMEKWGRWRVRTWWLLVGVLILIRMAVVARDEIVPIDADSTNYAFQTQYYLSNPPNGRLPAQAPGLSWLAIFAARLGIPFKLALDLIFTVACVVAGQLVRKLTRSDLIGLLLFAWLLLNPWFINSSVLFMSEPLTAILMLGLGLSVAPLAMQPTSAWRWTSPLAGAGLSTYFVLVRTEFSLLVCIWIWVAVVTALQNWRSVVAILRLKLLNRWWLVFVPIVCMFLGIKFVERMHLRCYGVSAVSISDAAGFRRLLNALYSIEPEQKIRFAPVTRQSLGAACDVSPTLNAGKDILLDEAGSYYITAQNNLGVEHEFGTWLNWLLVQSFGGITFDSNQAMFQAAEDIQRAQLEERLPRRRAYFPVDPLIQLWWPDVFPTFWRAIQRSFFPGLDTNRGIGTFVARRVRDCVEFGWFDDGLMRRHGTTPETQIRVNGSPRDRQTSEFHSVGLARSSGRPVAGGIILLNKGHAEFKLEVPWSDVSAQSDPLLLVFYPKRGSQYRQVTVDLGDRTAHLEIGVPLRPVESAAELTADKSEIWRIHVWFPREKDLNRPNQVQRFLNRYYYKATPWFLLALFGLGWAQGACARRTNKVAWYLVVLAGMYLGRTAFYTLLQIWTGWGLERYVETNHLVLILLVALLAWLVGVAGRAVLKSMRPRGQPASQAVQIQTDG